MGKENKMNINGIGMPILSLNYDYILKLSLNISNQNFYHYE